MMVMTAKVDLKKMLLILAGVAVLIIALIALLGGGSDTPSAATAAPAAAVTTNDDRVKFLTDLGWKVNTSPSESGQVHIPTEFDEVFQRYNALQQSQGYDLTAYAGKNVMRYVYKIENDPNAPSPVYATLLIYKNAVIGGDITDTAANGTVRGLKAPTTTAPQSASPAA